MNRLTIAGALTVGADLSLTRINTFSVGDTMQVGGNAALDSVTDADFMGAALVTGAVSVSSDADDTVAGIYDFTGSLSAGSASFSDQDRVVLGSELTTTSGGFSASNLNSLSIAGVTTIADDLSLDGVVSSEFNSVVEVTDSLSIAKGTDTTLGGDVTATTVDLADLTTAAFDTHLRTHAGMAAADMNRLTIAGALTVGQDLSLLRVKHFTVAEEIQVSGRMTGDGFDILELDRNVQVGKELYLSRVTSLSVASDIQVHGDLTLDSIADADFMGTTTVEGKAAILSSADSTVAGIFDFTGSLSAGSASINDQDRVILNQDLITTEDGFSADKLNRLNVEGVADVAGDLSLDEVAGSVFNDTVDVGGVLSIANGVEATLVTDVTAGTVDVGHLSMAEFGARLTSRADVTATDMNRLTIAETLTVGGDLNLERVQDFSVGGAVEVSGSLSGSGNTKLEFGRGVRLGRDLQLSRTATLSVKGDTIADGSLTLNSVNRLTLNGTTSVGGTLGMAGGATASLSGAVRAGALDLSGLGTADFGNGLTTAGKMTASDVNVLTVHGDLMVGSNLVLANVSDFHVYGATTVNGSAEITGCGRLLFGGAMTITGSASMVGSGGTLSFQGAVNLGTLTLSSFSSISIGAGLAMGGGGGGTVQVEPETPVFSDNFSEDLEKINRILRRAFVLGGSSEQPWSSGDSAQGMNLFDMDEELDEWIDGWVEDWLESLLW